MGTAGRIGAGGGDRGRGMGDEGRWTGGGQTEIVVVAVGYSHMSSYRGTKDGSVRRVRLGVGEWVVLQSCTCQGRQRVGGIM